MSKSFGFSVLGSDVDLDDMLMKKKNDKQPKVATPPPAPTKKNSAKPKPNKKAKEVQSLQALAFGDSKPKKKSQSASSAQNETTKGNKATAAEKKKSENVCNGASQNGDRSKLPSDDWQSRDQKFVEEVNERELREAIMLSKLEYEANKDVYEAPEQPPSKENSKTKKKKKDKPVTLSLSEFNTMNEKKQPEVKRIANGVADSNKKPSKTDGTKNLNFFSDLDSSVRNTIAKEARQKEYAEHLEKQKNNRPSNTGSLLVPVSEVEKRDFEIQALRLELDSLRDQLERVKLRNKKLCEVMGMAEMRSVSEIVVELEKVSKARDEFSAEVASLSEQLEQEKTKVSQLQEKSRKK
ncbi:G kinase-anchoring protein 1 [Trinorchestia longiramus]|nr:G kinase-anchoring protein 1 [Trinorchestia longiramus]